MPHLTLRGNGISEVRALTGVRGIAALYVVLFHYFTPLPLKSIPYRLMGHGYLAVDLFFPLSGFVMALNYAGAFGERVGWQQYRLFLVRRIARIYPLYLVTLVVASVLMARGLLYPLQGSFWTTFGTNLFMIQNWGHWESMNAPSWSISTEWCSYLFFPLLMPVILRSERTMWLTVLLCALGLVSLDGMAVAQGDWPKLFDQTAGPLSLLRCLAEFTLGMAAYRSASTRFGQAVLDWKPIVYFLLGILLVLLAFRGTDIAVALLFPWFVLSLSGRASSLSRLLGSGPIEYLGVISYSLYLVHPLFGPFLGRIDGLFRQEHAQHTHLSAVAVILPLLLLCSAATFHIIENPGRRGLRRLLEGKKPTGRVVEPVGQ